MDVTNAGQPTTEHGLLSQLQWMLDGCVSQFRCCLDLHLAGIISFVVNNTQLEFRSDFEIGNLTAIVVTFQLSYGRTKSEDRGSRDTCFVEEATFCNHIRERARGGECR